MFSTAFYFVALIIIFVLLGGTIYFCCRKMGTLEKRKFRHTIYRGAELEDVLSSKPIGNTDGPETKHKVVKTSSKGDDFYSGKDSLRTHHHQDHDDTSDLYSNEEKVHAGMPKARVLGREDKGDDRVLGDRDRVLDS